MATAGLITPGAMGASVGAALKLNLPAVYWVSANRGEATRSRAERANLAACDSLDQMIEKSDVIFSVCPPGIAREVAQEVITGGFKGTYVDANAIAPATMRNIASELAAAGCEVVDGGIIGGPAWEPGAGTMLWLSGNKASEIADLFKDTPFNTGVVNDQVGSASALKMAFAAYTKGSTALLAAILAVADKEGVLAQLGEQWGDGFFESTQQRVITNSAKAWRFADEMREIARTFEDAGLPGGFHQAAAEVFENLSEFKDWQQAPQLASLLDKLKD